MMMFANRLRLLLAVMIPGIAILFGLANSQPANAGTQARPALQQTNLLHNPGFEGQFSPWSGIGEIQMASGWSPTWIENPDNYPQWFRPEYKRAEAFFYPNRVRNGDSAQQYFTFHASHYAGMYQQVFDVTPGQSYKFTIWAQVWSSTQDNPNQSEQPANPNLQVGIDPTGLWQINGPTVIWSPVASMENHIDKWGAISVEAVAQNNVITVLVRTSPEFPNKHNDMYWDDATLFLSGPPQPTAPPPPPPTNTPGPPTSTPIPSETPIATNTSPATNTPPPSNTPEPSITPEPTPTSGPTNTPILVATDVLTEVPVTITTIVTVTAETTEEPTAEATEIASNPTEEVPSEDTPEPTPEIPTSEQDEDEGDNSNAIAAVSLVGLGVGLGLLAAGAITMLRRSR
jgi:hypothetical protein